MKQIFIYADIDTMAYEGNQEHANAARVTDRQRPTERNGAVRDIPANSAVGGNAGGDPSATDFPTHYVVDYVRVYQQDAPRARKDRPHAIEH